MAHLVLIVRPDVPDHSVSRAPTEPGHPFYPLHTVHVGNMLVALVLPEATGSWQVLAEHETLAVPR